MAKNELIKFIKSERKKGIPDETIRIMLTANGWTVRDLEQVYDSLDGTSTKRRNAHMRHSFLASSVYGILRGLLYGLVCGLIIFFFVMLFMGK